MSADGTEPDSLLKRAERLMFHAETIVTRAGEDEDYRLMLQAIDRVRSSLELVMKAIGMLQPDAQVNVTIDARRQQVAFFEKLPESTVRALVKGNCPHCGNALVATGDQAALTA